MVEVEIGGQRIDRQYGDWMHIWNQLTLTAEQERGYNKMVGQTTQLTYLIDPSFADVDSACAAADVPAAVCAPRNALPETTLYIPLQFWFCRNPGLALPLIALQYHEVKINLELRPSDEVLFAVTDLTEEALIFRAHPSLTVLPSKMEPHTRNLWLLLPFTSITSSLIPMSVDAWHRTHMSTLIEQLQFTGDESVGSSSNKIKLNFNHPCKEVIFVVQPDKNVDYCQSFLLNRDLNAALGAQPFNYTDAIDALVPSFSAFSGFNQLAGASGGGSNGGFISSRGLFQDPGADGLKLGDQWGSILDTNCSVSLLFPHLSQSLMLVIPVYLMLEHSFLLRQHLTCTAGDRTQLLPLSSSLTDRTASLSVKVPTSTLFSHTSTTHVTQTLVSTSTHSHFALRSTSHLEHAISLVLTTLLFSLSFPPTPLVVTRLLRSVSTLPTTMSFVS